MTSAAEGPRPATAPLHSGQARAPDPAGPATALSGRRLQRHDLVRLQPAGWAAVLGVPRDRDARSLLDHWAISDLPLVVASQPPPVDRTPQPTPMPLPTQRLRLGLPAPLAWGRLRLSLTADPADIAAVGVFPDAADITALLPAPARTGWRALCRELAARGAPARVYGSHGWQRLTGLACLNDHSDVDLLVAVKDAAQADAAAGLLARCGIDAPRLDGELQFPDGAAVAWREWLAWRQGRTAQVMVKRLHGVSLEPTAHGLAAAFPAATTDAAVGSA